MDHLSKDLEEKSNIHFNANFRLCISSEANPDGNYMFGVEARKGFNPGRYDKDAQSNIIAALIPGKIVKGPLTAEQLQVDRIQYMVSEDMWILRTYSEYERMRDTWLKSHGPWVSGRKIGFPPHEVLGVKLTEEEREQFLYCTIWYLNSNIKKMYNHMSFITRKAFDNTTRNIFLGLNFSMRWIPGKEIVAYYGSSYSDDNRRFNFISVTNATDMRVLSSPMYCDQLELADKDYFASKKIKENQWASISEHRAAARNAQNELKQLYMNFYPCITVKGSEEDDAEEEEGKYNVIHFKKC